MKRVLDRFYAGFDFKGRVVHDPIGFPRRYKDPGDIEVAGFIASCLAYGRVDLFMPVIEKILLVMGRHPAAFLRDFDASRRSSVITFKYRFNGAADIAGLLHVISELMKRHGSIGEAFRSRFDPSAPNTGPAIIGLVQEILRIDMTPVYGCNLRPPGFLQFFPSPEKGSACKRMNLYLRWMVRDRDIDLGIWKGIPQARLVIPLDTHIARIGRCLGLTARRAADWKAAVEITESLRLLDPADPLKYDFALCHHGISGLCGPDRSVCRDCALAAVARPAGR